MTNNQNTTEVWKAIPGWEGLYEASTHGRVRSLDRFTIRSNGRPYRRKGRILKTWAVPHSGHHYVALHANAKGTKYRVHRLILKTFVGEPPAGTEACHNNGNPADNRIENLRWDTKAANAQDTIKHGKNHELNKTHCPRGHALEQPNLESWSLRHGKRKCLACANARRATYKKPELKPQIDQLAAQQYARIMNRN